MCYFFISENNKCDIQIPAGDMLDGEKIDDILKGFEGVYSYLGDHSDELSTLDGVNQILTALGEIHPYAKAAVTVLTLLYKIQKSKRDYETDLRDLQDAMRAIIKRIITIQPASITPNLREAIVNIVKSFLDGVTMLEVYTTRSEMKKIFDAQFDTNLKGLSQKLAFLDNDLSNAIVDQLAVQVNDIHRDQVSERNKSMVRARLEPVKLSDLPGACLTGTREEILQKIDAWITSEENNILWIFGQPGSGKTTIAASVFSNPNYRCVRFFFDRREERLRNPKNVWRTIGYRLAEIFPQILTEHVSLVNSNYNYAQDNDLQQQFKALIQEPLMKLHLDDDGKYPVVVLDALDECDSGEGFEELLQTFHTWSHFPWGSKLIITSRNYSHIRQNLDPIADNVELITGDDVDETASNEIRMYLIHRFQKLDPTHKWPGDQKITELVTCAAGLFIWAKIALDYLGSDTYYAMSRLGDIPGNLGTQQKNLDALYEQVLRVAIESLERPKERDELKCLLGTIVSVRDPLSPIVLARLLGLNVKSVQEAAKRLSAVLHHDSDPNHTIRVCHKSFSDFLNDLPSSSTFHIKMNETAQDLANGCLNVLMKELKFNICNLGSSYYSNSEVKDLELRIKESITPQLVYATQYWAIHLSKIQKDDDNSPAITNLTAKTSQILSEHLLHWFEVLSLIGVVTISSERLLVCAKWLIDVAANAESGLLAIDASKFATKFHYVLQKSSSHIYLSALPFSPMKSLISKQYFNKFQNLVKVVKGTELEWSSMQYTIHGHENRVNSVAFSPDGTRIVSGSADNTIRVWDSTTGASLMDPISGHNGEVYSIAFSPDGTKIVSGSSDDTIRVWNSTTGASLMDPINGHNGAVYSIAFSPDGTKIVSGSGDNTIRVWDSTTGASLMDPIRGHNRIVYSVTFSPDGTKIVSGSSNKILVCDSTTGASLMDPISGHDRIVYSITFSPDGTKIVSGSHDRTIRLWDSTTGASLTDPIRSQEGSVYTVVFSPDGTKIVSGSDDKTIRVWDSKTGASLMDPIRGHDGVVRSVAFSSDGTKIVSGSYDRTIRVWDLAASVSLMDSIHGHEGLVSSVAFSSDGARIVSGSRDGTIRVWDSTTGASLTNPIRGHDDLVHSVAFSPDGARIVSGSDDKTIRVWNSKTSASLIDPIRGHEGGVRSVVFSPDGTKLISGSLDRTVRVWDSTMATMGASLMDPICDHEGAVYSVAISPDGTKIVSGSDDHTIGVWDSTTGVSLMNLIRGHQSWVSSVTFSSDGARIVSGSGDKTIRVWDSTTGVSLMNPIRGHGDLVSSVAFSSDGTRIVSGSGDKTIRIWDSTTGMILMDPFRGHESWVSSVAFSPDGTKVVSGSGDQTIRIWDSTTVANLIDHNCRHEVSVNSAAFRLHGKNACSSGLHLIRDFKTSDSTVLSNTSENNVELMSVSPSLFIDYKGRIGSPDACYIDSDGWLIWPFGHDIDEEIFLDRKILWIPPENRFGFLSPRCEVGIGHARFTKLDFNRFKHGSNWTSCAT